MKRIVNSKLSVGRAFKFLVLPLLLLALMATMQRAEAATIVGYFRGDAYGSYAFTNVGFTKDVLGRSAWIVCGCQGTNGKQITNQVAGLDGGALIKVGVMKSTTITKRGDGTGSAKSTSEVAGLNILNGAITLDVIKAVSQTKIAPGSVTSDSGGSAFVGLKVLGKVVVNPAPNTKIKLPGIGHVMLYETAKFGDDVNESMLGVNMIHVYVNVANALNLPINTHIIIGHAASGFKRANFQAIFNGSAYAEDATVIAGVTANLGKVAPVWIGCEGTLGVTSTNTINSTNAGKLLISGTATSSGKTTTEAGGGTITTSSKIEGLKLLNGLVTADVVTAQANSKWKSGKGSNNFDGSQLVNLKVLGLPVLNITDNKKVNLLGFGYMVLRETKSNVTATSTSAGINMIHLVITTQNLLNIPIGTDVVIGVANTSMTPFK